MNNFLVVNNFNAGRKQAIKYKKTILDFLIRTKKKYRFIDIDQLAQTDISMFDVIIAVGGDGTINKIIPFVINTNKVIGIIPCGTANLLAAKSGIPSEINSAIDIIEQEKIKSIDIIKINEKYSALRTGFGYDSDIVCKTPQSLKNKFGYFSYFLAGILFSLRLKQKKYILSFDNKKLSIAATCLIIANAGNMFKNIVSVSKNCKLDDGLFDVFILKVKNPILFFIEFLQIIFDKKSSNSKAAYFQCSKLSIKNDFCTCHIDGEKQKIKDNIEINIIPKSVNIFCNL